MRPAWPLVYHQSKTKVWLTMGAVALLMMVSGWFALDDSWSGLFQVAVVTILALLFTRLLIGFGPLLTIDDEGIRYRDWPALLRWEDCEAVYLHYSRSSPVLEFVLRGPLASPSATTFRGMQQRVATLNMLDGDAEEILRLIEEELEFRRGTPASTPAGLLHLPMSLHPSRRLVALKIILPGLVLFLIGAHGFSGSAPWGLQLGLLLAAPSLLSAAAILISRKPVLHVTEEGVRGRSWKFTLPWREIESVELLRREGRPWLRFYARDPLKYLSYANGFNWTVLALGNGLSVNVSLTLLDANPALLRHQLEAEALRRRGEPIQRPKPQRKPRRTRYGLGTWRR